MNTFEEFLNQIDNLENRAKTKEVLDWVASRFQQLENAVKWNQPMFIDHGTYIIGFSVAKKHLAVGPEKATLDIFSDEIKKSGYDQTKMLFKIRFDQPVDYGLLEKIIEFNISEKAGHTSFWR